MEYRRSYQPGGSFFFTLVTHRRQHLFSIPENIDRLRNAFRREKEKYPFVVEAIVILPDHLHAIWTLPEGDTQYSVRWSRIKRYFSIGCVGATSIRSASRCRKRERPVWQRRFWEHTIRDERDWRRHMDYIHYNPVKHGYVRMPGEWPYSSFAWAVRRGWYEPDWRAVEPEGVEGIGCE